MVFLLPPFFLEDEVLLKLLELELQKFCVSKLWHWKLTEYEHMRILVHIENETKIWKN